MSHAKKMKMTKQQQKPKCGLCAKAGLMDLCMTHTTTDAKGKNLCPTAANRWPECRYCYQPGHALSWCPEKKADEKQSADDKIRAIIRKKDQEKRAAEESKKDEPKKSANVFSALCDSDSDDEEAEEKKKKEKKQEQKAQKALKKAKEEQEEVAKRATYAARLAASMEPPKRKPSPLATLEKAPAAPRAVPLSFAKGRCWADVEDSDEEDEEPKASLMSLLYKYEDQCTERAEKWR
jgi:hypothetical protein